MSMPLYMNLFAALAIVLPLIAGGLLVEARRAAARRRHDELTEALDLLRTHTTAMVQLDDDRVPPSLLALACTLSYILHDPEKRDLTLRALRASPLVVDDADPKTQMVADAVGDDYRLLSERHPDLAAIFIQALVAGIYAFDKRWPECAGRFAVEIPRMASSPVQEAQRIVREAGTSNGWEFGRGAIAA